LLVIARNYFSIATKVILKKEKSLPTGKLFYLQHMINKLVLQSIINKYYLGENESVKWKIKDKTLSIDFISPNKEVIGNFKKKYPKTWFLKISFVYYKQK
jgi:hypothetical protein